MSLGKGQNKVEGMDGARTTTDVLIIRIIK